MMLRRSLFTIAAAAVLAISIPAQAYPTKTITVLVGWPAGGPVDIATRQTQPFLEKHLGGKIAVVNKPGAGGALANSELAKAKPDGYTMMMLSLPGAFTILFGGNYPYSVDSFTYLGTITNEPFNIFVRADSPYKTLKDLAEAAKAKPGSITIGGAGAGGAPQLGVIAFENASGLKFNYVPMQGAANMVTAVLGGHVMAGITTVSGAVRLQDEKQAVILGLMQEERWADLADVPTFKETGFDVEWGATRGFIGPKGLPAEIVKKWEDAIAKTHADPEFQALAKRDRQILFNRDGKGFQEFSERQYRMLEAMWKNDPWKK